VTEGSVVAWLSVSHDNFIVNNTKFTTREKVDVVPFFSAFNLSPNEFDPKFNFVFPKNNVTDPQVRGGLPYFQPIFCNRFGVNVSGKYDGGKDDWLLMNSNPAEWAVAFHGIRSPGSDVPANGKTVLESIMSGR
jgi:hypothetical protein